VLRDLRHHNADVKQFKAILAAEIIKALDREQLSARAAHGRGGIAAADSSRIRNADLRRFTIDRLMSIIKLRAKTGIPSGFASSAQPS
jgi:hypothetical protein